MVTGLKRAVHCIPFIINFCLHYTKVQINGIRTRHSYVPKHLFDTHPLGFSFRSCLLTFQYCQDPRCFLFLVNVYLFVAQLFLLTEANRASFHCRYNARVIPDVPCYSVQFKELTYFAASPC